MPNSPLSDDELRRLKELLDKATPGEWCAWVSNPTRLAEVRTSHSRTPVVNWQGFDDSDGSLAEHAANAEIMAASKRLLAEVEAGRLAIAEKEKTISGLCDEIAALEDELRLALDPQRSDR